MLRTLAGTHVPAGLPMSRTAPRTKKFLVVIQYYEGDREAAEDLASLIAELERVRNREADLMIVRRHDAREFPAPLKTKLESKFGKVHYHTCRRMDARGYPWGCNAMFSDLIMLLGQSAEFTNEYYAFINLETDCCPLHPGWIGELSRAYVNADASGKSAIGTIRHKHPIPHLNGVAVYAIDILHRAGASKLKGGNPQVAYDIFHAETLMPHAEDTPLIVLDFQRQTITSDELFFPPSGFEPAVYHGVKDSSAREAVRARHVLFTDAKEVARRVVFTFSNPDTNYSRSDEAKKLAVWRDGWRSRGWNPVVLGLRDAMRNSNYTRLTDAIAKLPYLGQIGGGANANTFLRWLAVEAMGGGVYSDSCVLPGQYTPGDVTEREIGLVLTTPELNQICAAVFDKPHAAQFIERIIGYDAQPDDTKDGLPHVTDFSVWNTITNAPIKPIVQAYGEPDYKNAKLVHFSPEVSMKLGGENVVMTMEHYLRGE